MANRSTNLIGFDLDNTLIDYSKSVYIFTEENKLSSCSTIDELRQLLKRDEIVSPEWIQAQSWIYTKGLKYAQIANGALDLIDSLVEDKFKVFIVSHKTNYCILDNIQIQLRANALTWIQNSRLSEYFKYNRNLFFEQTRYAKVERIGRLNLNYFVDDLEEVFLERNFPTETVKFLFNSSKNFKRDIISILNFDQIKTYFDEPI